MISPASMLARKTTHLRAVLGVCTVLCAASVSAGCSDDGADDAGTAGTGGSSSNGAVTMPITDANQYTSVAVLDIPIIETAATDITIDWSGVVSDLQCHDVDPTSDIVNVSFLRFDGMTEEDVQEELTKSRLDSNKVDEYWDHGVSGGEVSAKLSTFELLGGTRIDVDSDFTIDENRTYLALVQVSSGLGVGTKSMVFVRPTEEGGNSVSIGTGCPQPPADPILTFTANLDKPKVAASADGPWVVGWGDLTKDGTGGEIALAGIDKLLLGFYPGMDPSEVATEFYDIEELASPMWELNILGNDLKADLSKARKRNADGTVGSETFSGFAQGEGTWMVALTCSTCANPQPVVLAILDPSGS